MRAEEQLRQYIAWFLSENPIVAATKVCVDFYIGNGWTLGGEVSRIDMDLASGGYRAILLGAWSDSWQYELRMPLLQAAVAEKLKRLQEEITLGVQNLDGSSLEVLSFSSRDIEAAQVSARELSQRLRGLWESIRVSGS